MQNLVHRAIAVSLAVCLAVSPEVAVQGLRSNVQGQGSWSTFDFGPGTLDVPDFNDQALSLPSSTSPHTGASAATISVDKRISRLSTPPASEVGRVTPDLVSPPSTTGSNAAPEASVMMTYHAPQDPHFKGDGTFVYGSTTQESRKLGMNLFADWMRKQVGEKAYSELVKKISLLRETEKQDTHGTKNMFLRGLGMSDLIRSYHDEGLRPGHLYDDDANVCIFRRPARVPGHVRMDREINFWMAGEDYGLSYQYPTFVINAEEKRVRLAGSLTSEHRVAEGIKHEEITALLFPYHSQIIEFLYDGVGFRSDFVYDIPIFDAFSDWIPNKKKRDALIKAGYPLFIVPDKKRPGAYWSISFHDLLVWHDAERGKETSDLTEQPNGVLVPEQQPPTQPKLGPYTLRVIEEIRNSIPASTPPEDLYILSNDIKADATSRLFEGAGDEYYLHAHIQIKNGVDNGLLIALGKRDQRKVGQIYIEGMRRDTQQYVPAAGILSEAIVATIQTQVQSFVDEVFKNTSLYADIAIPGTVYICITPGEEGLLWTPGGSIWRGLAHINLRKFSRMPLASEIAAIWEEPEFSGLRKELEDVYKSESGGQELSDGVVSVAELDRFADRLKEYLFQTVSPIDRAIQEYRNQTTQKLIHGTLKDLLSSLLSSPEFDRQNWSEAGIRELVLPGDDSLQAIAIREAIDSGLRRSYFLSFPESTVERIVNDCLKKRRILKRIEEYTQSLSRESILTMLGLGPQVVALDAPPAAPEKPSAPMTSEEIMDFLREHNIEPYQVGPDILALRSLNAGERSLHIGSGYSMLPVAESLKGLNVLAVDKDSEKASQMIRGLSQTDVHEAIARRGSLDYHEADFFDWDLDSLGQFHHIVAIDFVQTGHDAGALIAALLENLSKAEEEFKAFYERLFTSMARLIAPGGTILMTIPPLHGQWIEQRLMELWPSADRVLIPPSVLKTGKPLYLFSWPVAMPIANPSAHHLNPDISRRAA